MIHHPRVSRRAVLGASLALPAAATLAACRGETLSVPVDNTPTKITYLTNFGTFGRDAYAWLGQAAGHFADHGLEVDIQPGSGTQENVAELIAGNAHFAAVDLAGAAMVHGGAEGSVTGYVALAAIHQLPLATMMGRASRLQQPSDLEGGKIGLTVGAITELLFEPWARLAGLDPSKVEKVFMPGTDLIGALATDEVQAIGQFVPGLATVERVVGEEIAMYPYSDHIDDLYGVGLLTTEELASSNPDLCVRARDAMLAALAHALEDPAAAGEALAAAVPEASAEGAAEELELMAPYCVTPGAPIGTLDEVRMSQHLALLQALGLSTLSAHESDKIVAWDLVPGADDVG